MTKQKLSINDLTHDQWFAMLREIAVKGFGLSGATVDSLKKDAWRGYFDDGMSPYQAVRKTLDAAGNIKIRTLDEDDGYAD